MSNDAFITGVEYPHPFDELTVALCSSAVRNVCILSPALDHAAFDNEPLAEALSTLARRTRSSEVRILVSDTRKIVGQGHRLLRLARRASSAIKIRRLIEHPEWRGETIVIRDSSGVLYLPGGSEHEGFYEPDSRASTQAHLDLFNDLWRYSVEDPDLREL